MGSANRPGLEGAAPRFGSVLVPFVELVLPGVAGGPCTWRLETDPTAFAAENFPANSQGTLLEQNEGIPTGVMWRIIQILPNTRIGSLLSSVDFQSGCRRTMAL